MRRQRGLRGWSPVAALVFILLALPALRFDAAAPIRYRFTFPQPEHHWMQVAAEFTELDAAPLELRMSRSSPGRYSLHDFSKNVYDVRVTGADGRQLTTSRPDASGWVVSDHGGAVTLQYKVYGDTVDGTYLAVDATHAHINMPAAIMWARGFDDRAATLVFEPPAESGWRAATQLHAGTTPLEFTAPNLQYLMDSPVELGPLAIRQFSVGSRTFRFAAHHTGDDVQLTSFVRDVERIVREEGAVFGEYPAYEPGAYTFLADYLPYATVDGMEHRNSTVMTAPRSIAEDRRQLAATVAHEFFHNWNVERIRPRSLEPFDLDRPNASGELWLAEGFTQYYEPLMLARAGLTSLDETSRTFSELVDLVTTTPARLVRSAVDMSLMAPFIDGGRPVDRTNWSITVLSYYPYGGAIALALDLTLRERSDGRTTLDDFMRAMWRVHGKPGGSREGYVDRPYTIDDAEARLAEVANDPAFAHDFFARYVRGREAADYPHLLMDAGFAVRSVRDRAAWWGDVDFESRGDGARVSGLVAPSWPIGAAGLDQDDLLMQIDGEPVASGADVAAVLRRRRPGDRVDITFMTRAGARRRATVTLAQDPHVEVAPIEMAGGQLTPPQRRFRDRWLKSALSGR